MVVGALAAAARALVWSAAMRAEEAAAAARRAVVGAASRVAVDSAQVGMEGARATVA